MTGVIPFFIIASMMALEHGAQQVWRRTLVSPIGASILSLTFFIRLKANAVDITTSANIAENM
jgi:hypothetical protein